MTAFCTNWDQRGEGVWSIIEYGRKGYTRSGHIPAHSLIQISWAWALCKRLEDSASLIEGLVDGGESGHGERLRGRG